MDTLDEAFHLLATGEKEQARNMVARILQKDSKNVTAWRLLASLLDDPERKMECYRRIIAIEPDNEEIKEKFQPQAPIEAIAPPPPPTPSPQPRPTPPSPQPEPTSLSSVTGEERTFTSKPSYTAPTTSYQRPTAPPQGEFVRQMLGVLGFKPKQGKGDKDEKDGGKQRARDLSPEEIIAMAGGAMPEEERRSCPKCHATVSIHARRCEWCGTQLEAPDHNVDPSE